jgi:hypothetical protein
MTHRRRARQPTRGRSLAAQPGHPQRVRGTDRGPGRAPPMRVWRFISNPYFPPGESSRQQTNSDVCSYRVAETVDA